MVRTQIQLTENQLDGLRRLSSQSGRSMSDLIREGVDAILAGRRQPSRQQRVERALRAAGRFRSGSRDVSRKHDRYLGEAFGE